MGGCLDDVDDWLEEYRRFWDGSFDRLDGYLRELQAGDGKRAPGAEQPPETD
jgi:hypothetical protein